MLFQGTGSDDTINGTSSADQITGGNGNDVIEGRGGNDSIQGEAGNDELSGGAGKDTMWGGTGADLLVGGSGDDTYYVSFYENDVVYDESGADIVKFSFSGASLSEISLNQSLDDPGSFYLSDESGGQLQIVGGFSKVIESFEINGVVYSFADLLSLSNSGPFDIDGTDEDDSIRGGNSNDSLNGQDGNDWISGGAGNDRLLGGDGLDQLFGGDGVDTLWAGEGNDVLEGNAGADSLSGDAGADTLRGGAGNDTLDGGAGNDVYAYNLGDGFDVIAESGGESEGTDVLSFGSGISVAGVRVSSDGDSITFSFGGTDLVQVQGFFSQGFARIEEVRFTEGAVVWDAAAILAQIRMVLGTEDGESITGTEASDTILSLGGNDTLYGLGGNDVLDGGAGVDSLIGGLGNDTYVMDDHSDVVSEGVDQGIDTVKSSADYYILPDNVENLILTGTENSLGQGNALNNAIYGNQGNNIFATSLGVDTFYGGLGDDIYYESRDGTSVVEYAGEGTDAFVAFDAFSVLPENVEILNASHSNSYLFGPNRVTGNGLDNVLISRDHAQSWPLYGPDDLVGDRLDGGLGADTYIEGNYSSTNFVIDNVNDVIVLGTEGSLGEDWDTVESYIDFQIFSGIDQITLIGTGAIAAYGDDANNKLSGEQNSAGNLLVGGGGDDTYNVGNGDQVFEVDGGGDHDRVRLFAHSTQAAYASDYANVEIIELTNGNSFIELYGDGRNNTLISNDGDGVSLFGGAGNDDLRGRRNQQILDGGTGDDSMAGGSGDDRYIVDSVGDVVTENYADWDPVTKTWFDGGHDTVVSSINYTLGEWVESLVLTGSNAINGTGNSLANTLSGEENTAANTLTGLDGDDDYFFGQGDVVVETANAGIDTIHSKISVSLPQNVENIRLEGVGHINATGNALSNFISGNDGNNILSGESGNDTLDGGLGQNTLDGGAGNDVYLVKGSWNTRNIISSTDHESGKLDTLRFSESDISELIYYRNGANLDFEFIGKNSTTTIVGYFDPANGTTIERIEFLDGVVLDQVNISFADFTGTNGNDNLTGSAGRDNLYGLQGNDSLAGGIGDDQLFGDAGNDTLDGGEGIDRTWGGAGDDVYYVDNYYDIVKESGGEGSDTVYSRTEGYILSANIEKLVLLDSFSDGYGNDGANSLIGNAESNYLEGGGGNDTIDGGTGSDSMVGGTGDDTYIVDSSNDVVEEAAGEGIDTIETSLTLNLSTGGRNNVENLKLTGSMNRTATGNNLDNYILGNSANNTLIGGAGNDTLDGGLGDDGMTGGAGDDYYILSGADTVSEDSIVGSGNDTVETNSAYTLLANFENLVLGGTGAYNGTGNGLDNRITGNVAANKLTGGDGNDTLIGAGGSDTLQGDNGNDYYRYNLGDGQDTVSDTGGNDQLEFGAGIASTGVTASRVSNDLYLTLDASNRTVIQNYFSSAATEIEQIRFVDGSVVWDHAAVEAMLQPNQPPVVATPIGNQAATEDQGFSFTVPAATFSDPNPGDTLILSAKLANNSDLPSWLTFNPNTKTFSGTPLNGDVGSLSVMVTARDPSGESATSTFTLDIVNTNDAPMVDSVVSGQQANVGVAFSYQLPINLFKDVDIGDTLSWQLTQANGTALPSWLVFNAATRTLSGTAASGNVGTLSLQVKVLDGALASATQNFSLQVTAITNQTLTGTGNADNMIAGAGNDTLSGAGGNDTLQGLAGNDSLDGGAGNDTMIGGTGDDIYIVAHSGDVVTENVNEGIDTVRSALTYTLGANVEKLELTGTVALSGTGNELDNSIKGNNAANTLSGGAGNDLIEGGAGTNIADVLNGDAGNDTLDGGTGNDTMTGGDGDDFYYVNATGDKVIEGSGAASGYDIVKSDVTLDLSVAALANIEGLILGGATALNGTGSDGANLLRGNTNKNTLTGKAGNDLLEGGDGNDTLDDGVGAGYLNGGAGKDTLTGGASGGTDNEIFIGGVGDDAITTGTGSDIIVFNAGDGLDKVAASTGKDNTISLGGGITYGELAFQKSGNNLIVKTNGSADTTESITFTDWYTGSNQSVKYLQMMTEGAGYNPAGNEKLNNKIELFDFTVLLSYYNGSGIWTLTQAALDAAHLANMDGDTAAMGGDLAYQYGTNNRSLANVGITGAQNVLGAGNFGTGLQSFQPPSILQQGASRLI